MAGPEFPAHSLFQGNSRMGNSRMGNSHCRDNRVVRPLDFPRTGREEARYRFRLTSPEDCLDQGRSLTVAVL